MSWFNNAVEYLGALAKSDVVRDMVLQASHDIYVTKVDRDHGYTEVKFANEGDDLRVLGEDQDNLTGGYRVMNMDNNEQIETVQLNDLDNGDM